MESNQQDSQAKQQDVMETASATTSSDNSNSGPFAYIVFGIASACLILIMFGLGSGVSLALMAASEDAGSYSGGYSGNGMGNEYPYSLDENSDLNDIMEFLENNGNNGNSGGTYGDETNTNSGSSTATVDEALDFDLAVYSANIESYVSATAYAGAPSEVRDFVRDVVSTDKDYATRVANCLNSAAINEDERADKIAEAKALCEEAEKAISDKTIPTVEDDKNGVAKDALGTAKSDAAKRWSSTKAEIELLSTGEDVDTQRLWDADEEVLKCAEDAGTALEDAMARTTE